MPDASKAKVYSLKDLDDMVAVAIDQLALASNNVTVALKRQEEAEKKLNNLMAARYELYYNE